MRKLLFLVLLLFTPAARTQERSGHPLLVGYFPQWGIYNQPAYFVKNLITSGSASLLDQLNYAQGFVVDNRCAVADPNADLNLVFTTENSVDGIADDPAKPFRGNFHQLQKLKKKYPKLKILISLEGKAALFAEAAKPEHRQAFVASCIDTFIHGNFAPGIRAPGIFDGIDLDWEYPNEDDRANYVALLTEFRRQLNAVRPGQRLSIAVGANEDHFKHIHLEVVSGLVDQVGVMNYDYNGPWSHTTGLIAPLYSIPGDPIPHNNIDETMQAYIRAGVPAHKLLLGVPFYAYHWEKVNDGNHGLFQAGQAVRADQPYNYIQTIMDDYDAYRDPLTQAPWLFDGHTFWTYEDPVSIRHKWNYAQKQKLGGAMVWELGNDTPDAELLKTIHAAMHARPVHTRPEQRIHESAISTR